MSKQQQVQQRTSSDTQKESEGNPRVGMAEMAVAKHLGSRDCKFPSLSIFLLVAIVGFFATTAQAELVLRIDSSAKNFSLTGSDTAEVPPDMGTGYVYWEKSDGGGAGKFGLYDSKTAFTTSVGQPGSPYDIILNLSTSVDKIFLNLYTTVPDTMTITGTGVPYSYADFSAGAMSRFESLIGSSLQSPDSYPGWGSISVVPEPTSAALFAMGLAGCALVRRRSRSIS